MCLYKNWTKYGPIAEILSRNELYGEKHATKIKLDINIDCMQMPVLSVKQITTIMFDKERNDKKEIILTDIHFTMEIIVKQTWIQR